MTDSQSGLREDVEPTPGFEPGTFSLLEPPAFSSPSDLWTLANSS
jgi:hypothetical protein